MAVPDNATFGTFADGGDLIHGDIVVGLRSGVNTRFNFQGDPGLYLPLAGGVMQGAIDMDGNSITGLPTPTLPSDAVPKSYADGLVAGEAMSKVDDTNVTLTLGGTPLTSLLHAVSLTLGWTGQLSIPRGGTGLASLTAYAVLCGGTTSTGALQQVSGLGTANQVLVSNGAAALPSWQSVPGLSPAAMTRTDDTNVTLTLGGTPSTSLLQAVSLTLGWSGQLSVPRGGTGNSTFTAYSLICAGTTDTGAFQNVSGVGTLNQVLISQGAGALPIWGSVPGVTPAALTEVNDTNVTLTLGGTPTTALLQAVSLTLGWTGQLGLTRGGTAASLTAVNGGIVYSNASSLAISAAGSAGQILQSAGAATPVWSTATYPATAGSSGNFMQSNGTNWTSASPAALTKTDDTNVTLTLGGTPTTALMAAASLTLGWTGQLSVPRGGTGLASATAYAVLCGGTTSTGAFQSVSGVGTTGQALISNGAAALPTWQNLPAATLPSGSMFNFQQAQLTTPVTTTSTSFSTVTGLSIAITPTSASNKVLIRAVVQANASAATNQGFFQLFNGTTAIGVGTSVGSRTACGAYIGDPNNSSGGTVVMEWLDTPATTSAVTYSVQFASNVGGQTVSVNATVADTNSASLPRMASTISVCEIKA